MRKVIEKQVFNLILTVLLYSCASQAVPTGGIKDKEAPIIETSVPNDKSTNYNGRTLEIIFNELISVENIKQELLITPKVAGNYEYEVKKNRLSLTFEKTFENNTTYTFNFRKSIKDITEKNIAENTKIVFSTGDVIDSLYIQGQVVELLTNKPIEDGLIMLYKVDDTLTVTKHAPYYLTKTDKKGNYLLENLKEDAYLIYALTEKNNNQKYDQEKEQIGYAEKPIDLTFNIDTLNLSVSIIDTIAPKIPKGRIDGKYYQLEFNEGITKINIEAANRKDSVYYQILENRRIKIYNTFDITDSIPLLISAQDSAGNILQKDIKIKFNTEQIVEDNKKPKVKENESFTINTIPSDKEKVENNLEYTINFSKPVSGYSLQNVQMLADTITPIELQERENFEWTNNRTELKIRKKINVQKNVRISIPEGTFFSVEGDTSANISTTHDLKDVADYGTISGKVITTEKNYIVQLVDPETKVIAELKNVSQYKFNYLQAGKYRVRVIIDSNGNGKWDQGNFNKRTQPEQIIFSESEITLKENWDQDAAPIEI